LDLINYLQNSDIIKKYSVDDIKLFSTGFYIKLEVELINKTKLYIREYSDEIERKYSYHWQDKNNNLIIRWDNAPHYKNIITFPHHKHENNKIFPSYNITIKDILKTIKHKIVEC
jgi:hypothetical protein